MYVAMGWLTSLVSINVMALGPLELMLTVDTRYVWFFAVMSTE